MAVDATGPSIRYSGKLCWFGQSGCLGSLLEPWQRGDPKTRDLEQPTWRCLCSSSSSSSAGRKLHHLQVSERRAGLAAVLADIRETETSEGRAVQRHPRSPGIIHELRRSLPCHFLPLNHRYSSYCIAGGAGDSGWLLDASSAIYKYCLPLPASRSTLAHVDLPAASAACWSPCGDPKTAT